jgi:hypothetical protein
VAVVVEEPIGKQEPVRKQPGCMGSVEEICIEPEDCIAV